MLLGAVSAALGARQQRVAVPPQGGGGSFFFEWDAVSAAIGYRVYWGTAGGPPYANSADVGNVLGYTPAGLVSGTTYYLNVTAYDESGFEGPWATQLQKVAP